MGIRKMILRKVSNYLSPAEQLKPEFFVPLKNVVKSISAWEGLEQIIPFILEKYNIPKNNCLEFGVEHGYSTSVFAQLFNEVTGVDTFEGDKHAGFKDSLKTAQENLSSYKNVRLIKQSYQEYIKSNNSRFDLCHIDIIHTYKDTYDCGEWAIKHCTCILFHDTESYMSVRKAVYDLSKKYKKRFLNYPLHNGLGILI